VKSVPHRLNDLDFPQARTNLNDPVRQSHPRHHTPARQVEIIGGAPSDFLNQGKTPAAGANPGGRHGTVIDTVANQGHAKIQQVGHKNFVQFVYLGASDRHELNKNRRGVQV
jgi:hypothetical protein